VTGTCILAIQEALADAQSAVRFLRTNAATYGIDTTRIAIGGIELGDLAPGKWRRIAQEDARTAFPGSERDEHECPIGC